MSVCVFISKLSEIIKCILKKTNLYFNNNQTLVNSVFQI